jgi:hypothetical protein
MTLTITITNLTPHPVTIHRTRPSDTGAPADREPYVVTYPACATEALPRATEGPDGGDMAMTRSDGQGQYENSLTFSRLGIIDEIAYVGVEGLPPLSPADQMFGVSSFSIVSIVTVIGALAAGRGIEDLLVPVGQVRDAAGRVIGATGLAPATSLMSAMYRTVVAPIRAELMEALRERNAARAEIRALTPSDPVASGETSTERRIGSMVLGRDDSADLPGPRVKTPADWTP